MNQIRDDVRFALRYLRRRPGFAAAALLTLALAIGATTAVFSLVYGVLLRPLDLREPERLVMLFTDLSASGGSAQDVTGVTTIRDWQKQTRSFAGIAGSLNNDDARVALAGAEGAEAVVIGRVTHGYFDVLGARPEIGRELQANEEVEGQDDVAVISHQLWQRTFAGDPGVLGKQVRVDGVPRTIVGVMPQRFRDPLVPQASLWLPLSLAAGDDDRGGFYVRAVGRLRDGVRIEQANAELAAVMHGLAARYPDAYGKDTSASVAPLQDVLVGNVRPAGTALFAAVLLVLLIACVNLANLLLARSTERGREIAVRTAMGAGKRELVVQLLTESLVLAGGGGLLGVLAGAALLRLLVRLAPAGTPRLEEVALHGPVLLFAAATTLVVGLLFGLLPALRMARGDTGAALRREGRGVVREGAGVRRGLIVAEIAISLALLVGAGLLVRTLLALGAVDPGFAAERLVAAQVVLPESRYAEQGDVVRGVQAIEERLAALPGVQRVAATSALPLTDYFSDVGVRVEGVEEEEPPGIQYSAVTGGFFAAFGVPLLAGRTFDTRDNLDAARTVIVNQPYARRYLGDRPLGRRIKLGGAPDAPWREVVGVVGAVHHGGLSLAVEPQVYLPHTQVPSRAMQLVVRASGDPERLYEAVRRGVRELDAELPVMRLRTGDDLVAGQLAMPRFVGVLIGGFAVVALALALVGVYGVMAFLVAQRRREVGVRLALGARPREVLALVLRESAVLAAIGAVIGAAAALVLSRGLGNLLFGVRPADPMTLVVALAVTFAAALIATAGPARRAAALDPMQALREE